MPLSRRLGVVIATLFAACGAILIVAAAAARQSWLDRHFLPSFFVPRHTYVLIETIVRLAIGLVGVVLVVGRWRIARTLTRAPVMTLQIAVAAVVAVAAAGFALRWLPRQPTEWLVRAEEPRRQADPRLGWMLVPSHTGTTDVGGRTIEYATDAAGYRVRRADDPVDVNRPTILFVGESVMFGEGLTWEESIPAQASATTGIQSANLAVHGYSTDQMYLRLADQLPRFRQPIALVAIFMTELFGRDLDSDRPHLGPGLVWLPAAEQPRLMSLAALLVPFRRESTVDRGIRVTREVLHAIVDRARERGASALVVVPQFGSEDDLQRSIRAQVLTGDIPSLLVPLDPNWRLAWDRHPNARAAHLIGAAVAERLQR